MESGCAIDFKQKLERNAVAKETGCEFAANRAFFPLTFWCRCVYAHVLDAGKLASNAQNCESSAFFVWNFLGQQSPKLKLLLLLLLSAPAPFLWQEYSRKHVWYGVEKTHTLARFFGGITASGRCVHAWKFRIFVASSGKRRSMAIKNMPSLKQCMVCPTAICPCKYVCGASAENGNEIYGQWHPLKQKRRVIFTHNSTCGNAPNANITRCDRLKHFTDLQTAGLISSHTNNTTSPPQAI